MQGQLMAMRHGWRWLSAGQLLRDTHDPKIYKYMRAGKMIPHKITNKIIFDEIDKVGTSGEERRHILDGYPRDVEQAKALVGHEINHCGKPQIDIIIVIDMTKKEILKRLSLRGRLEDNIETIENRLKLYAQQTAPMLEYFKELGVPIERVNGVGTVGEVHDRIQKVLEEKKIVGAF
jgi:adenylate kinase